MELIKEWLPQLAAMAGFLAGGIVTWLIAHPRMVAERIRREERDRAAERAIVELEAGSANLEAEVQQLRHTESAMLKRQGELEMLLETQHRNLESKRALLKEAEQRMGENFKTLTHEALRYSQHHFLEYARTKLKDQQAEATSELEQRRVAVETIVQPVAAVLEKVESRIEDLEQARVGAYANLQDQVREMATTQLGLQKETAQLVEALRQPAGRGRWGDLQLNRVVELAGMQEHCDFLRPDPLAGNGATPDLRPELLVNLPGGKTIAVDAKAPMEDYLDTLDGKDEALRSEALGRHVEEVSAHIRFLGSKRYFGQFETRPEFVVFFLPSESFFSSALTEDPSLIEQGVEHGVILATPTTLIALLRAAAAGWSEESIADKARDISNIGRELYTRLSTVADHFSTVGRSLDETVANFNTAVGSLDNGALPTARKLVDLGAAKASPDIPAVDPVERISRQSYHDLSNLPVSSERTSLATTGEVANDAFEGFAAPAAGELDQPATDIEQLEQRAGNGPSPDADGAAGDLRAALANENS